MPAPPQIAFRLLFVIKEAFYKLHYPITGVLLDHLDVEACLDMDASVSAVRVVAPSKPAIGPPEGVSGSFATVGNYVVACTQLFQGT